MLAKEVPVERMEGASIRPVFFLGIEAARGAVVTHLVLIGGSGGVRFRGKEPAIGKENHSQNVRNHDPVVRVEVHFGVPAENGFGFIPTEKEVVSENHQALNMMIVGVIDRTVNRLGDATHFRLARIGPLGQGAIRPEEVDLSVLGHFEPVDAVDKLPPAEDLADESLDRVEGGFTVAVGFFRALDAFERSEESQIQKRREHGVEEDRFAIHHGVFPRAELFQTLTKKKFEPIQGAFTGGGNPEIGGLAGVLREKFTDVGGNFLNNRILDGWRERRNLGFFLSKFAEGAAVLIVEVPVATFGLTLGGHENISFSSESSVVRFHEEMLFSRCPCGELSPRNKELGARVRMDGDA